MQQKFLRSLSLLLVLNLLIKPIWIFGIDRTVQNMVGASEYGFYFAILNFSFLFNILLDFGITNFNNKNIAQNNHLLQKYLSNILVLKLLLFFVYLCFTLVAAFLIRYDAAQVRLLMIMTFNQFLISFILYLRSNLGGLHLFRTDSIISVLDRSLMIVICGVLIWGNILGEFSIRHFVYAQTLAYLMTVSTALFIVISKAGKRFFRLNWNLPFMLIIIRQSFPFAVLVLLMTFYNRIDSVMLERMLDNGATYSGFYASAYRLLDASNMVAYLFAVLLLPIFSKMIKYNQPVEKLVTLSYSLIITPAIIVVVGAFFYSAEIMQMLYPIHPDETLADFSYRMTESARVFGLLMACFVAISTSYIFGTLLTANGNLKYLNLISLTAMSLNIILNLMLIPRYQATGSAVASMITQFSIATVQIFIVKKVFGFRYNGLMIIRIFSFALGTILLFLLSKMLPFDWKICFMIMAFASLLLALFTGLLNIRDMVRVLRHGENHPT